MTHRGLPSREICLQPHPLPGEEASQASEPCLMQRKDDSRLFLNVSLEVLIHEAQRSSENQESQGAGSWCQGR